MINNQDSMPASTWWGSTLSRLKTALAATRQSVKDMVIADSSASARPSEASQRVTPPPPRPIDEEYLEELEEKLIKADVGASTAAQIVKDLRIQGQANNWNSRDVEAFLKAEFAKMLSLAPTSPLRSLPGKLSIILVVGVNGTGKTTTIGKLCWRLRKEGKKVLVAAADTFRAAAETQLEIWVQRAGADIVSLPQTADPGAVVFTALQKAQSENYDVLIVDTAGRLHNKANLMSELKKIRSVIDKNSSSADVQSLLVLDASTGQNGLQQARIFTQVCPLTGVVLTKLDGSARGGVILGIVHELKLPVQAIGIGEKIEDLADFEPQAFIEALFAQ